MKVFSKSIVIIMTAYRASQFCLPSLLLGYLLFILPSTALFATDYNYPTAGGGTLAVAPQTISGSDTLNINSGTFAATGAATFTATNNDSFAVITVSPGATISYAGTNASAATIAMPVTLGNPNLILNNRGTISIGTGSIKAANAIDLTGTTIGVSLISTGLIDGPVLMGNSGSELFFGSGASINCSITGNPATIGFGYDGATEGGTFSTFGEINLGQSGGIYIYQNGTSVTFNYPVTFGSRNIICSGGNVVTFSANASLDGTTTGTSPSSGQSAYGSIQGINGTLTFNAPLSNIYQFEMTSGTSAIANAPLVAVENIAINNNNSNVTFNDSVSYYDFTVGFDASATINSVMSGFASTLPSMEVGSGGSLFIGSSCSFDTTNSFFNSGNVNIANNFDLSVFTSGFSNSGDLYVYDAGTITGNLTAGTSLTVGQDSTGASKINTSYTTGGSISGIPILDVYYGKFLITNPISTVSTRLQVHGSGSANITNTVTGSGSGVFTNDGATYVGNTVSGFTTVTNNGALYIFGASGAIPSNFVGGGGTSSLNYGKDIDATPYNNTYTNNIALTNTPTIHVFAGTMVTAGANSISGVSAGFTIDPGAAATLGASYSGSGAISIANTGTLTVNSTFGTGTITNDGMLVFSSANNSSPISNASDGTFNISGNSSNSASIDNFGHMTLSAQLSGTSTITNKSGANFSISGGTLAASNAITVNNNNGGTLAISGSSTHSSTVPISNSGSMSIAGTLTGSGSITNNSNGTLTLSSGVNVSNAIDNAGGDIAVSAAATAGTITGNGTIAIAGTGALSTTSLTNSGTQTIAITGTGAGTYGTINSSGAINLSGANLTVTSTVATNNTWTLITAAAGQLTAPANITLPTTTLFSTWSYNINALTTFEVQFAANDKTFSQLVIGPVNQAVATVLDNMAAHITNSGQQTLINAFNASTTIEQINKSYQEMIPNMNASAPNVAMQNSIFNKIETRIASVCNGLTTTGLGGISAGDINANTALWLGGFGSFARQAQDQENFGYRTKGFGGIIGLDTFLSNGVLGLAAAFSKTLVHEYSNQQFVTSTIGYHGLIYGTNEMPCDRFLEWLITGAFTYSKGSRMINVSNVIMSTTANSHGGQGAIRLNYGINFACNDLFIFAPIATTQYAFVYQPDYNEQPSPAALHVSPTNYQNIFTIGTGARLSFPCDDWWLWGTRELHALITYDAISSQNSVASNFLVGSDIFTIINPAAARFAFKAGIDLAFMIISHLQLQFSYDYEVRQKYYDHSAVVKLKYLF